MIDEKQLEVTKVLCTSILENKNKDEETQQLVDCWKNGGFVPAYYFFPSDLPQKPKINKIRNELMFEVILPKGKYLHLMPVNPLSLEWGFEICCHFQNGKCGYSTFYHIETTNEIADKIFQNGPKEGEECPVFIYFDKHYEKWFATYGRFFRSNKKKGNYIDVHVEDYYPLFLIDFK